MFIKSYLENNPSYQFSLFLLLHLAIWTLIPALSLNSLPLDSVECLIWGNEWQAGYSKHPPLSAWISEAFFEIFSGKIWSIYFLSQIAVCLAFIGNWQLAREFLPKQKAFLATIILEGLHFYNFSSPEFNPNVLSLPIVAWFNYFAWQVYKNINSKHWLSLAIIAALGILSKYSFILHLASFVLLLVFDYKNLTQRLKNPQIWLAVFLFIGLLVPHLIWLKKYDFLPLQYIKESSEASNSIKNHLLQPLSFIGFSLFLLLPIFLIFLPVLKKDKNFSSKIFKPILSDLWTKNESIFLLFLGFGAFFLLSFESLLTGGRIKDMWGYAMWNMAGIMLFYFFKNNLAAKRVKKFWIIFWLFFSVFIISYIGSNLLQPNKYSLFDGKNAAKVIQNSWDHEVNKNKIETRPIKIIAGDMWIAGDISLFMSKRPQVFIDLDLKAANWISYADLKKNGGVLIWNARSADSSAESEIPQNYQEVLKSAEIDPKNILIFGSLNLNLPNANDSKNPVEDSALKKPTGSWLKPINWQGNLANLNNKNRGKIRPVYAIILPSKMQKF